MPGFLQLRNPHFSHFCNNCCLPPFCGSLYLDSRSSRGVLSHTFCLYSLVHICKSLLAVSFSLSTVFYFSEHGLVSKYAFLFSILIILFRKLLFLLFSCNSFSSA